MHRIRRTLRAPLVQSVMHSNAAIKSTFYREVAEWLKAHAWKVCIPKGIEGSNPFLSAILNKPQVSNLGLF